MKEFTLLITILFNFPNGEHQEIQVERKQMSEADCHIEYLYYLNPFDI